MGKLCFTPLSNDQLLKHKEDCVAFVREEVRKRNKNGIVIGVSGGVDSAVAASLAVEAVGHANVKGIMLPEVDSNPESLEDANLVVSTLCIQNYRVEDITSRLQAFGSYDLFPDLYAMSRKDRQVYIEQQKDYLSSAVSPDSSINFLQSYREVKSNALLHKVRALWNSKIRMRMMMLYFEAELHNCLVLGTTNKTEYQIGYFTNNGDGAVDLEPLLSFYKTRVFEMAKFMGIPEKIVTKKPTGDILPGFHDEMNVGMPYHQIDLILLGLEQGMTHQEVANDLSIDKQEVEIIQGLIDSSYYYRNYPTVLKLALEA